MFDLSRKENKSDQILTLGAIYIIAFVGFLVICWIIAHFFSCIAKCCLRKGSQDNYEPNNFIIFTIPCILVDFILDILFVKLILRHEKEVEQLFLPSLVFLIGPIFINIVFSVVIIIRNVSKEGPDGTNFRNWINRNTGTTAITTVLAGADMTMLNLLTSNFSGFGLRRFNAPFSEKSKELILYGCLVGSFVEDLPQFAIQIIYKLKTGEIKLVPFLLLVTSSIKLLVGMIYRIYKVIHIVHTDSEESESSEPPINV
ncbi:unnamed protein product [Rhizophagus irregularis]|uniref:Uncharacterized protein n=1 Tax=Rhizophagus irregularis TaxID=588596 RepID=A0A2I1EKM9_9GLOM|nr:hypothetical protein RhiirB3_525964 [Rhizophagus irregularis]CAB4482951.1 unnamed protein product [Rhizophagus irregularis]CAB5365464.1 unnamed protein product [Rhizophagus irregularis]